jgi:hypothetical protein
LTASAWTPDFGSAEDAGDGVVEVTLDEPNRTNRFDLQHHLPLQPVAQQRIPLDALPPGEYAIEVTGWWDEGTVGFAFRVVVQAP